MFLVCVGVLAVLMPLTAQHSASSTPSFIVGAMLIGGGVIGFWLNRL
jgi:predicted membrane protein